MDAESNRRKKNISIWFHDQQTEKHRVLIFREFLESLWKNQQR